MTLQTNSSLVKSPVLAIALFGSRARGDNDPNSDTDLLLVTPNSKPHHISEGNLSLSFYPQNQLLKKAKSGDLFLFHIVSEAKNLYDPSNFLSGLKKEFRYRKSYKRERHQAADLGWFLIRHIAFFKNQKILNRRIAWCVRTLLIARAAEQRNPIFSADRLATSSDFPAVKKLIEIKNNSESDTKSLKQLAKFLEFEGFRENQLCSIEDFISQFRASKNEVALNTLKAARGIENLTSYE